MNRKNEKKNKENMILISLTIIATILSLLWIFPCDIRNFLLDITWIIAMFHGYMIGLIFPEAIYIKLLWDNRLNNPKIPIGKKKMFSRGIFVIGGGIIAFVGFLISNFLIVPFLNTSYIDIINSSFFKMTLCGIWLIISIPLLPFIMFAIGSPAGLKSSVKSMKKLMET